MTEQSKTYFHIQWSGLDREAWQKGDQITTQKSKYNPFYSGLIRDLEHIEFDEDKKVGLIEYSNSIFGKDVNRNIKSKKKDFENLYYEFWNNSFQYESLANKLHWSLFQYLKWIREEIFEKLRFQIDGDLPSRKHCIWISQETDLQKWWNMFKDKPDKKILQIKLLNNNKIHRGDGTLIRADTYNIKEYEIIAKSYWSGEIINQDEIEFSYEGAFEVINEFRDIIEV